ncbi:hypothetical protein L208DRAFT_1486825, partial [Tricholoma matsutake]
QLVTVSGLDTPFFDNVVVAVSEIYGVFDHAFTQGALGSWVLMESHCPSLEASNCYFMPTNWGYAWKVFHFKRTLILLDYLLKCRVLSRVQSTGWQI